MRIGVAREIKPQEYRVALTPAGARELVLNGHEVLVETSAGVGSAFADADYEATGARILSVDEVWEQAELLLKVKEPVAAEYGRLREGLVLFTYLHIAADEPLTRALVDSGIAAVAYETVETDDRRLPLLAPMSEVAGRLAAQAGAYYLERPWGGRGRLLGDVTADHARRPCLQGRRRHALLRGEHAWRRPHHLDEGAHERDAPLRRGDRRPWAGRRGRARRVARP